MLCIAATILWEAFNFGQEYRIFKCSHAMMLSLFMHPCRYEAMHFLLCVSHAARRSQRQVCTCSMWFRERFQGGIKAASASCFKVRTIIYSAYASSGACRVKRLPRSRR